MQPESQASPSGANDHFIPRARELEAFADLLPLKGVEGSSKRVVNLWGERQVGKSTFISEFRESELAAKSKILWLQPTREESLDTVQEFIRACSQTVRYPSEPQKEEKIADNLESVQRGKVNPIVSDDSILITRTTLASNRKPYVNQAAASSVGRTEPVREDIEISVGLGESKANNQAEGFLDALPLQALGTDLTILYLEKLDRLSLTVLDWLRDYVIPAATRGPYRRSVIVLIESLDPLALAQPNGSWGEWDHLKADFRLYPLSEDDVYQMALRAGLDPETSRYVWHKSHGYAGPMNSAIQSARSRAYEGPDAARASQILDVLDPEEQYTLGALCLPDHLYPDELDGLFGPQNGKEKLKWLANTAPSLLQKARQGEYFQLPEPFRKGALARVGAATDFKHYRLKWAALARLMHNVPSKSDRSKLLMLSGLDWLDESLCRELFREKADRVLAFVVDTPLIFNRHQERYRVSERLRPELIKVAEQMQHQGVTEIQEKALALWEKRRADIDERIAAQQAEFDKLQAVVNRLAKRHSETAAQLRIAERKQIGERPVATNDDKLLLSPSRGPMIFMLITLALAAFGAGFAMEFPYNLGALVLGLASLSGGLAYIPGWLARRRAIAFSADAQIQDSPEFARRQNIEIAHEIQRHEAQLDELKQDLDQTRALLHFPYAMED